MRLLRHSSTFCFKHHRSTQAKGTIELSWPESHQLLKKFKHLETIYVIIWVLFLETFKATCTTQCRWLQKKLRTSVGHLLYFSSCSFRQTNLDPSKIPVYAVLKCSPPFATIPKARNNLHNKIWLCHLMWVKFIRLFSVNS